MTSIATMKLTETNTSDQTTTYAITAEGEGRGVSYRVACGMALDFADSEGGSLVSLTCDKGDWVAVVKAD